MERFGARYLVLYKAPSTIDDLELVAGSSFLAGAASHGPTCGFALVAENPDVLILELATVRN
jgi:hypothetical protein